MHISDYLQQSSSLQNGNSMQFQSTFGTNSSSASVQPCISLRQPVKLHTAVSIGTHAAPTNLLLQIYMLQLLGESTAACTVFNILSYGSNAYHSTLGVACGSCVNSDPPSVWVRAFQQAPRETPGGEHGMPSIIPGSGAPPVPSSWLPWTRGACSVSHPVCQADTSLFRCVN